MQEFETIEDAVRFAKRRHPKIRAHREEDDRWFNLGLDALASGKTALAENFFLKLMLSQPEHSDGYTGLAQVCAKTRRFKSAILLMKHSVDLARKSYEAGETDLEVVQMFQGDLDQIIADSEKSASSL